MVTQNNFPKLQTKPTPELKEFLAEFCLKHSSDWALLNRVRAKQLQRLLQRERHLVEVFHEVYRRDRRIQRSRRICPDPSGIQQQEMLERLQQRNVITDPGELIGELKQVAAQLRQYNIWSSREPLEIQEPQTGSSTRRPDLLSESLEQLDVKQHKFFDFLREQLPLALTDAIEQEIKASIAYLEKSKNYAPLAQKFMTGLQLYYIQRLSFQEIAIKLGMTSLEQVNRVLNLAKLLSQVRTMTVQKLLDSILKRAKDKDLTTILTQPDDIINLAQQTEAFVDEEVFTEAVEEIRIGKNRRMNSIYVQQFCQYLNQHLRTVNC